MRRLVCVLVVLAARPAASQTTRVASSRVTDYWVAKQEALVLGVIEAMPAVKYPFTPTAGEFSHVRTFGQMAKHLAAFNYIAAASAAAAIDDGNAIIHGTPTSPLIDNATRLGLAEEALIHSMDHYGQMIEYLRMNGVVPPASR
jgi:hypothetical protein